MALEEKGDLSRKVPISVISIFLTKLGNNGQKRKIRLRKVQRLEKGLEVCPLPGFLKDNEAWPVKKPGQAVM